MKPARYRHFKVMLLLKLAEINLTSAKTRELRNNNHDRFADPLDKAAKEGKQSMDISMNDPRHLLIEEIKAALHRIDTGAYGICSLCGDVIDEKRLMVNPTTRLCLNCQEREIVAVRNGWGRLSGDEKLRTIRP